MKHAESEPAEVEPAEWGELERSLFRAGREEAPAATRASVLAALGLEGPGPGPGGNGGGGRVHTSEPSRPIPWSPSPAAGGNAGKWLAGVAVAVAIPAAIWLLRPAPSSAGAPESVAVPATQVEVKDVHAASQGVPGSASQNPKAQLEGSAQADDAAQNGAALASAALAKSASGAPKAPAPSEARSALPEGEVQPTSAAAAASSAEPSLAEEVALIRRARTQLSSGDAAGALASLDEHTARFKKPKLSSEATVLRIDALLRSGKQAEARRLAAPIIASDSPYATRVRTLVGNTAP